MNSSTVRTTPSNPALHVKISRIKARKAASSATCTSSITPNHTRIAAGKSPHHRNRASRTTSPPTASASPHMPRPTPQAALAASRRTSAQPRPHKRRPTHSTAPPRPSPPTAIPTPRIRPVGRPGPSSHPAPGGPGRRPRRTRSTATGPFGDTGPPNRLRVLEVGPHMFRKGVCECGCVLVGPGQSLDILPRCAPSRTRQAHPSGQPARPAGAPTAHAHPRGRRLRCGAGGGLYVRTRRRHVPPPTTWDAGRGGASRPAARPTG